ncbi:MAG: glycosyltransferase [Patescibacteria group bacterium]|nr:glycosyltransferase [Patescibacteria group bacterium]MDD4610721.1 glycosyltransferase [Patescibacteria group bacterium]
MLIDFCLPAYNEEKILEKNILALLEYLKKANFDFDWRIIIANSASTDATKSIGEKLAAIDKKIILKNIFTKGKGLAIKETFQDSNANIALFMDMDFSVPLDFIPALLEPIISSQADLVIGSRMLAETKIKRGKIREAISQSYNILSRLILKHHYTDLQCGFKAININVFKKIYPYLEDDKWFLDTELILFADRLGYQIKEIPVAWSENRGVENKSRVPVIKNSLTFLKHLFALRKKLRQLNLL